MPSSCWRIPQITTSVTGLLNGNGGDITIQAPRPVLQYRIHPGKYRSRQRAGGNVNIDVQLLMPSGNSLFLGGSTGASIPAGVFGYNVIQTAAPDGFQRNHCGDGAGSRYFRRSDGPDGTLHQYR